MCPQKAQASCGITHHRTFLTQHAVAPTQHAQKARQYSPPPTSPGRGTCGCFPPGTGSWRRRWPPPCSGWREAFKKHSQLACIGQRRAQHKPGQLVVHVPNPLRTSSSSAVTSIGAISPIHAPPNLGDDVERVQIVQLLHTRHHHLYGREVGSGHAGMGGKPRNRGCCRSQQHALLHGRDGRNRSRSLHACLSCRIMA